MVRSIVLGACALVLALGMAEAKDGGHGKGTAQHAQQQEPPLESIADEAAEVGSEGVEEDGMERNMDEMITSEDQDGCIGDIGNDEVGGCANALD